MAKFFAFEATDTVGSDTELSPTAINGASIPPANPDATAILFVYPEEYFVINLNAPVSPPTSGITSWMKIEPSAIFGIGAGDLKEVWKANTGDTYVLSEFFGLHETGDNPSLTIFTTEKFQQFWFKFDDKIHGSDFEDKLCGWADNDSMWGGDDSDEFYYGKGMDKDKIMDFSKKGDELILDDDFASNFKQLKKMAKYNTKKDFTKIKDGGDVLKVYGIDTQKELKQATSFDDFTDFG